VTFEDLTAEISKLSRDQRLYLFEGLLPEQIGRLEIPDLPLFGPEKFPTRAEQNARLRDRKLVGEKLALVGGWIGVHLQPLVQDGTLEETIAAQVAWPVIISLTPGREDYFLKVVEILKRAGLGTKVKTAIGLASRNLEKSGWAGTAQHLINQMFLLQGPAPIDKVVAVVPNWSAYSDADYVQSLKRLRAVARKLPPFTTTSALDWWKRVALPLLILSDPEYAPQRRGRRRAGEGKVNPKINRYRSQIQARFLDRAPGPGKSRSYKSRPS
jgi:hypothetical protein